MNFEFLPNEILLDLFDYFNGVDLLRAFYGLNSRFKFLLYKQFRFYCFKFSSITKRNFDMICQQHLPFIRNQVYALSLSDAANTSERINLFFSYILSFSQFIQLRSLSISFIYSYQTLLKIINECQHLCNLTHLKFRYMFRETRQIDLQLIIDTIWSLPKLRYCNFAILSIGKCIFTTQTKLSSTLEDLNIRGYRFKWNHISQLFKYTPRLKRLSISIKSPDDNYYIPSSLPTLINLSIRISCTSDASKMISFLQNVPNLCRLNVNLSSALINGYQWEQVMRNYLPKLEMKNTLSLDENMEERVDQLMDSFRSSFWIDEHRWFVRCLTLQTTIDLYTLPKSFDYHGEHLPNIWRSTYLHDNQQNFYNTMCHIDKSFFNQTLPSGIHLPNICRLSIKFPLNDQFWSIVPSLNQLYSLEVSFHSDTFQSQLQALLDRASRLRYLSISQDGSLPLQTSLFKYTNVSVRELDLQKYNYWFNEEKCTTLCHSPLGIQCEVLSIHVKNRESILILVKNMINLRELSIECEDENFNKQSISNENDNNELRDQTIENKNDLFNG